MNIAVFTKTEMCGGSEMRAVEICNAIGRYTAHHPHLISDTPIPQTLRAFVSNGVAVTESIFCGRFDILYEMDVIIVINTDSKEFTTVDYWQGRSRRHSCKVDLTRLGSMAFLFNFVVSPAQHLWQLEQFCPDVRIIVANPRFFNEISKQQRYLKIRHLPRIVLESPIDPRSIPTKKIAGAKIRIGKHSHALDGKFNNEHRKLIELVNARCGQSIEWDFMGVPAEREAQLRDISNVTCRRAFSMPVSTYLNGIHIFLFFISWERQEPWARSVAEGMMSGCPILATDTDGGNRVQVIDGNNGYLCSTTEAFADRICELVQDPNKMRIMGRNSRIYSRSFTSEEVIRRIMNFVGPIDGQL